MKICLKRKRSRDLSWNQYRTTKRWRRLGTNRQGQTRDIDRVTDRLTDRQPHTKKNSEYINNLDRKGKNCVDNC